jgi:hypothetical protein
MKKIFILTLFVSFQVYAEDQVNCSSKTVPIKMAGFSGYGEELKKTKQIAQLVNPASDQPSSFEKSFEIGKYRFVKIEKGWDIYRKNENGQFQKKNITGKFQVDADQKIWATVRADGSINIHRNVAGEDYQKEFNVFFNKKEVSIVDSQKNALLSYKNCNTEKTVSTKSAVPVNISKEGQK